MMNRLPVGTLAAFAVIGVLWLAYARERHETAQARVELHNTQAALDTSRIILRDSSHTLTERLAFQSSEYIRLSDDLDRLIRKDRNNIVLLTRLRLSFDSVQRAVTRGEVSGDSAIRLVRSRLDTLGFHVGFTASVPAPPEQATVEWSVSHEPESVIVALNRSEEGQLALRALTGGNTTARIDSTLVQVDTGLRHTNSLAAKGLLVLAGVIIGLLLK